MHSDTREPGGYSRRIQRLPWLLLALAVAAITTVVLYRPANLLNHGDRTSFATNNSCRVFLEDSGGEMNGHTWNPSTCLMHYYTKLEIQQCMNRSEEVLGRRSNFVFIGDSRMREQFHMFAHIVCSKPYLSVTPKLFEWWNYNCVDDHSDMELVWNPLLGPFAQTKDWLTRKKPSFVVICVGLWHLFAARTAHQNGVNQLVNRMKAMAPTLNQLGNVTKVIWMLQAPVFRQYIHSDNCSGGVDLVRERNKMRNATVCAHGWKRNELIRDYNKAIRETQSSVSPSTFLWETSNRVVQHFAFDTVDSAHQWPSGPPGYPPSEVLLQRAQMLLNVHCNRFLDDDKLCCANLSR